MKVPLTLKSVIIGKHSKAAGKAFEDLINNSCAWYMQQKLAKIEKQAEPMRPVKSLGRGQYVAIFESKAGTDYKGTLKGGRAVVFEAKHTDSDRILRNVVKEWQLQYLVDHDRLGALCFVLISFGMHSYYRIPIADWLAMKQKYGRLYLKEDDIQEYKLRTQGVKILFLEGLDGINS